MQSKVLFIAAVFIVAAPVSAAQFAFDTLVRYGANGGSTATNWEFGIGNGSGIAGISSKQNVNWRSGVAAPFTLTYNNAGPTGLVTLQVGSASTTYTPSASPALPGTTWSLPATAFFATVPGSLASISVTGMSITALNGAALNVISSQPANVSAISGGPMVQQSNDIVFVGDATGSWRLQGNVTLVWQGNSGGSGANLNRMQFGLSATANDIPEPGTWLMMVAGLGLIAARRGKDKSENCPG